jgi:hypothetical protein
MTGWGGRVSNLVTCHPLVVELGPVIRRYAPGNPPEPPETTNSSTGH